ncbi:TonB-dependent receptor [Sphingobium sp. SYK-6]|uniref:TonB-dependent receptor n=1 Tax=Sphingobium sp. (strain NBRC 103272 / SYK-6) TaxID=627192 RepID=UPI0002D5F042|nr:TonB-dependent receptor [Sphingobium sp. SYK-6]
MTKFRIILAATVASGALATGAHAQSTGAIDFEDAIIVTGSRSSDVGGIRIPDTTKATGVITDELISRQGTNTILNTINLLPGVSFQNNDPYGSAGGTLNIRGFGPDRVSLTWDGIPLNDTGNYAIYSNQLLDMELIGEVNVNLGSTDVDSPTAAASGGTVNYRTRLPYEEFNVTVVGAIGEYDFYRMFGAIDTGVFTPFGTRAFFAASRTGNDNVFNNYGKIDKQQYNGRIYQPIGSNGDFISIAGHYNENRNNFFGSLPLRTDAGRVVGPNGNNRYPTNRDERFYTLEPCQLAEARPGVADAVNACGAVFDYRFNPSNTGNIRGSSRFTLSDGLVLTVDPSYQYVKANGGGVTTSISSSTGLASGGTFESGRVIGGNTYYGFIGGSYYAGIDLNGDGDRLDRVTTLNPSQTQTHRFGVISSLRYDINEFHTVRIAYTYDRGRHRQTGELGYLQPGGAPFDVFPVNDPIRDANGNAIQKRDRLSYAILNQVSGEYRGEFLDEALTVRLGVRAPFFKRDLTQNCFTTSASGFVDCVAEGQQAAYAAANPNYSRPQNRTLKYDKVLPNVGLSYRITPAASIFFNYAKGLQVPGTDPLYNSFFFAEGTEGSLPAPETTDSFDVGARYTTSKIQAQLTGWFTRYNNRLASAYDPELNETVYRNLGTVDKWGIDGSIAYSPFQMLTLYAFGSYLKSDIKDDVVGGVCSASQASSGFRGCTAAGQVFYLPTAGKRESGAPVFQLGARAELHVGDFDLGVQGKRTGKRYIYDTNEPIVISGTEVYGAVAPGYTLFDLDVRYSLASLGAPNVFAQLNVTNVFDKFYVGGFGGNLSPGSSPPFVQIGAPRAAMFSVHVQM